MDIKTRLEGQNYLFRTKGAICAGLYTCFLSYVPCCYSSLKVRKSRKKNILSCILPKNERWGNFMYWKLPQHSFFGRIQEAIICFWDLLTFSRAYFPCILACISGQLLLSKLQICVKLNISLLRIINYLMHTNYVLEIAVRNCNSWRHKNNQIGSVW